MPRERKLSTRTRKQISIFQNTHKESMRGLMRELCSIIAAPKREKDEAKALKKQRIGLLGRLQREEHEEKEKLKEGKGTKVGNKKFQQMTSKAQ